MLRDFANVGLFLFLVTSIVVSVIFFSALVDGSAFVNKLWDLEEKNLSFVLETAIVLMWIGDYFILRRFIRWWKGKP